MFSMNEGNVKFAYCLSYKLSACYFLKKEMGEEQRVFWSTLCLTFR